MSLTVYYNENHEEICPVCEKIGDLKFAIWQQVSLLDSAPFSSFKACSKECIDRVVEIQKDKFPEHANYFTKGGKAVILGG
jgi:hypothetical protein